MKKSGYALIPLLIAGCAEVDTFVGNDPIVETQGISMVAYEADLADCQAYADQVNVAGKTATGTATGAVVGGAVGAMWDSSNAGRGAGAGAVTGAVGGVGSGLSERKRVVRNCLTGRGYRVLN